MICYLVQVELKIGEWKGHTGYLERSIVEVEGVSREILVAKTREEATPLTHKEMLKVVEQFKERKDWNVIGVHPVDDRLGC